MASPTNLARQLAAYLPETLARRILRDGLPQPGRPFSLDAATLFSDISGFTAMSEELAADGPRGAEEVNRVLLLTFTGMIDIIHDLGGAVSHFYGDAMSVYFPDEDGTAACRALACAQMMQTLMQTSFKRVVTNRPPHKNPFFELTIKIGMGYGRCQELVVGTPETGMEFVLTGPAIDEAAAAEKYAKSGQVVASWAALAAADQSVIADFAVVTQPVAATPGQPLLGWTAVSDESMARLETAAAAFVPPAITERLKAASAESLAEHRPVTSLFVQFEFAGDKDDTSAIETAVMGQQLQDYYTWACRLVSQFGSENARVNRVLTGDKGNQLHIIFGAPVAPDAPEQAIRCMMAMQRQRPDFIASQKIGLTAGKVFAGPVGAVERREYTVVGDVVNLSARLMQICRPGEVWTDRATAVRAQTAIDFVELPPVKLKGKQLEVTPLAAQKERAQAQELQTYLGGWKTPLVGRTQELALMRSRLDAALSGQGKVIAVVGATGAGKTRLVAAGAAYWLGQNGRGFVGEGYQHTTETPFGPWRQIWRSFFGLDGGLDAVGQATAVVNRTRELVPSCGDDVGLWGEVLGLPMRQAPSLAELTAEVRKARFFALVRRCLTAAAAERPLLLILEGLHWADQASLALIDELAAHIPHHALALILAYRSQRAPALDGISPDGLTTIPVSDLSPDEARHLLNELVGVSQLPPAVEQQLGLRDRAGRDSPVNPLFLEESVNVMMGMGALRLNGRVQVDEALLGQMQVPDTIHGLLLARLDRLPPASRDVLQIASVIGREFGLNSLSHLTPTAVRPRLVNLLETLTSAEMTRLLAADPEWVYLFQHAMTHEVAYESLPYARRQELHAAIANWLEMTFAANLKPIYPTLAYHYGRADIHDKGLRYALAAGDAARDIFANAEAIELYTQAERHLSALGVDENWETAVDLYLARGDVARYLGEFATSIADGEKALDLALVHHDLLRIAQANNLLADIKFRLPRFDEVLAHTAEVIALNSQIPLDQLARAYQWSGMAYSALGDYKTALDQLREAEKLCENVKNNRRLALVLEAIAYVYYSQKDLRSALDALQRSVNLSRHFSIPANVASVLNNIALVQFTLGDAREALVTYEEAETLVVDVSRSFLATILSNKGEVLAYLGQYKAAESAFITATNLFTQTNDVQGLIETYLRWGSEYHSTLGNWDVAAEYLGVARQLLRDNPGDYFELEARLNIGDAQLAINDKDYRLADQMLQAAQRIIEEKGLNWWEPVLYYFQGRVLEATSGEFARQKYRLSEKSIQGGQGCPDYQPMILLQLAKLSEHEDEKRKHLFLSAKAAEKRARYGDKIGVFRDIGQYLIGNNDPKLVELGERCLKKATALSNKTIGL